MNRFKVLQAPVKWLNARDLRERAILLCAGIGLLVMSWLVFVHDPLVAAQESEARNILLAQARLSDEQKRQNDIRSVGTNDPNAFANARQRELLTATAAATERLSALYGELISPQQMSQMLTTLLQRETMLSLVSLENQPPEPLVPAANASDADTAQVYRHGLRMVFEGSFIETVNYLRSIEGLEGNLFWDKLDFEVQQYPQARISVDIYTLSTEQGWIGV